ncbi:creatininase family protein [Hoeflea sp. BAL378]|uniref:creatininase family protein n=1 Tax=Hoeflea sp. BAL378 TaxID=1547437 RepID=UPI0009DD21AA|nr:creatininase family protein [Hoeflea sp. BAL378]
MPLQSVPIAILPLGAHEQHGPHLPFETDALIAQAVAERLAAGVKAPIKLEILPVESVGYSIEHMDVSGTRTLAFDEAVHRWLGIAGECAGRGMRRLMLLNAHGGNSPLLTIVATEARVRFNMLAVATSWTRFGVPQGLISPADKALDIHGGEIETSVMLAIRPDLVRLDALRDFPSRQADYARRFTHLRAYGPHAFGWKMSDLNTDGAAGNASRASAEKGEALLAHAVHGLGELLADMAAFDVSELA